MVYMYAYMYICICMCISMCVYVYICIYICVHVYVLYPMSLHMMLRLERIAASPAQSAYRVSTAAIDVPLPYFDALSQLLEQRAEQV